MADLFDAALIKPAPALASPRWGAAAWALAASLLLHALGLALLHNSLGLSLDLPSNVSHTQLFEATVLPATVLQAPSLPQAVSAKAVRKTTRDVSTVPTQSAAPSSPEPLAATPIPVTPIADTPITPPPMPDPAVTAAALASTTPTTPTIPTTASTDYQPSAMPQTQAPHPMLSPQMLPHTRLPDQELATTAATYSLPKQVSVRYETNYQGIAASSELQWKKIGDVGAQRYEASLVTSALGMELRYTSLGLIGIKGLAPLAVEEKRPFKSAIATTIEPSNNRVVISSQAGFLPYDPLGHDLVSLMIQLGIYAQSLPQWSLPGIAQDFTVYRPNGIKRWRLQSQGLDTIQIRGEMRQVVYIRRIAADGQPDYEDQYHFWLDPKRYGFPVKMRQIDNKGKATDIVMTDWKEQQQ